MEKSPASPVANAISNGDKRVQSPAQGGKRGERTWTGSESLGSKPDFPSLELSASSFSLEDRL